MGAGISGGPQWEAWRWSLHPKEEWLEPEQKRKLREEEESLPGSEGPTGDLKSGDGATVWGRMLQAEAAAGTKA